MYIRFRHTNHTRAWAAAVSRISTAGSSSGAARLFSHWVIRSEAVRLMLPGARRRLTTVGRSSSSFEGRSVGEVDVDFFLLLDQRGAVSKDELSFQGTVYSSTPRTE